jgi:hypothetical protein
MKALLLYPGESWLRKDDGIDLRIYLLFKGLSLLGVTVVITILLHCFYNFVTPLLHCCYSDATLLLHCCYTVVTLLLHCCYTVVTLLLHCCRTVVTLLSHCCHTVAQGLSLLGVTVVGRPPTHSRTGIVARDTSFLRGTRSHAHTRTHKPTHTHTYTQKRTMRI